MMPFIGVRISCDILARNSDFGAIGLLGGRARLFCLLARRGKLVFGGFAGRNVGKGPHRTPAGKRHIAELDHSAVGPPPLADPRFFESPAASDDFSQSLVTAIFLLSRLVGEDIVKPRMGCHQFFGQFHDLDCAAIAEGHHSIGVDYHDALRHMFECGLEKVRLFAEAALSRSASAVSCSWKVLVSRLARLRSSSRS